MLYYLVQSLWAPVWLLLLEVLPLQILLNCWLTMRFRRMLSMNMPQRRSWQRIDSLLYRVVNSGHLWELSFLISHWSLVRLARHGAVMCTACSLTLHTMFFQPFLSFSAIFKSVFFVGPSPSVHFTYISFYGHFMKTQSCLYCNTMQTHWL